MTNEEAANILEYPVLKWSMEWDDRDDGLSYFEAIEKAINVLRNQRTTEPLTLEQLREMDGQPVWVEDKHMPELSGWGIMRDDVCDGYHGVCFIEEYGKRWLAYAYPPAHIDREALESSEKGQVRISSLKGPNGLQIYIGFKCGKMEKDISFMFDKADMPLDEICKFLSQQLTELVQGLGHARESAEGGASV